MTDHCQMAERRLETWCTPITGCGEYDGLSGGTTILRLSMTWPARSGSSASSASALSRAQAGLPVR